MSRFAAHRDYVAGTLMALIGAGAIAGGSQYGIGSLTAMGSGFFPVALGVGLVVTGALMAATRMPGEGPTTTIPPARAPGLRAIVAIVAAVALFIALASRAGLAPATFACVFAASLGTPRTTILEATILAACVTVFGVLLFAYGLKVPFPVLRGLL